MDLRNVAFIGALGAGIEETPVTLADFDAYWKFNESSASDNAADATGNGHTLAAGSVSIQPVAGKVNGARECGSGAGQVFSDSNAFYDLGHFSLCGWFWTDDPIIRLWAVSNVTGGLIELHFGGTYLDFTFTGQGGGNALAFFGSNRTSLWNFFACGHDGSRYWISVNGKNKVFGTTAGLGIDSGSFAIGGDQTSPKVQRVDEWGLMKVRTLAQGEIRYLFNGDQGRDL